MSWDESGQLQDRSEGERTPTHSLCKLREFENEAKYGYMGTSHSLRYGHDHIISCGENVP